MADTQGFSRRGWLTALVGAAFGVTKIPPTPKIRVGEYRSGGRGNPSVSYHFTAVENVATGKIVWVRHV